MRAGVRGRSCLPEGWNHRETDDRFKSCCELSRMRLFIFRAACIDAALACVGVPIRSIGALLSFCGG